MLKNKRIPHEDLKDRIIDGSMDHEEIFDFYLKHINKDYQKVYRVPDAENSVLEAKQEFFTTVNDCNTKTNRIGGKIRDARLIRGQLHQFI